MAVLSLNLPWSLSSNPGAIFLFVCVHSSCLVFAHLLEYSRVFVKAKCDSFVSSCLLSIILDSLSVCVYSVTSQMVGRVYKWHDRARQGSRDVVVDSWGYSSTLIRRFLVFFIVLVYFWHKFAAKLFFVSKVTYVLGVIWYFSNAEAELRSMMSLRTFTMRLRGSNFFLLQLPWHDGTPVP